MRAKGVRASVYKQVICGECGKTFEVNPASKRKFCNTVCFYKWLSVHRLGMKFTDEHRANIAESRLGTTLTEETKEKLSTTRKRICNTPEWRKKMSDQVTAGWKDPSIREAMIEGQQAHFATTEFGSNYPVGTPETELMFAKVLLPAGYVAGYVISTNRPECNGGGYYKLDYAHVEAKVDIEIDGSSHRHKKELDIKRDAFLRALGWKVIRIKV